MLIGAATAFLSAALLCVRTSDALRTALFLAVDIEACTAYHEHDHSYNYIINR